MSIHHLDLVIEDGEPRIKFRCTGTPDASCRRRPPNWDESSDESWTNDEATETGFDCWAADWIDAIGMDDAVIGEDGVYGSAPILIGYEEGVSISPAPAQESLIPDTSIPYETEEGVVVAVDLDGTVHRAQRMPTDTQVLDALNAWNVINPGESLSDYADSNVSRMRAVLRAAFKDDTERQLFRRRKAGPWVKQEGETDV